MIKKVLQCTCCNYPFVIQYLMMTPLAWMSSLTYCSTVYLASQNKTLLPIDQIMSDRALVLAASPWKYAKVVKSPDCATFVLTSLAHYKTSTVHVGKARLRTVFNLVLNGKEALMKLKPGNYDTFVAIVDKKDIIGISTVLNPYLMTLK